MVYSVETGAFGQNYIFFSFFFQVAGPYLPQYDVYYKKLDVDGKGEIGAMEAATFLKKSGLSDEMLGKVIRFLIASY